MSCNEFDFDVIVAGAGPVGLTMTIDLGRRGVRTLIMERDPTTAPWPKMDRSNARTMEIYRRLGFVERVRALGYPGDNPMDVLLVRTMNEPPVARIPFDSVDERRAKIAACNDGSYPLEPYQQVSQNAIEPLLRQIAEEETPNTTVRYGLALESFEQDEQGVTVHARRTDGTLEAFRTRYLTGCDGGRSTVRKQLGIELRGKSAPDDLRQVIFRSPDLYERMGVPKGRHYSFLTGGALVAQGDRVEFTFHTSLSADTDFPKVLRDLIGFDCKIEVLHVLSWRPHLLLADRYREGRVFIAGDAAHLVIPTGGLGMNTGVGDAIDLSWKLAGTIAGWGGPELLNSYEVERRGVGARNIEASGWAADESMLWPPLVTRDVYEFGPQADIARERLSAAFMREHGRMHGMVGAEACYSYAGSPLVAYEPGNFPQWELNRIVPHVRAGVRIPHMWLKDGTALQDILGDDYTVLDLDGSYHCAALEKAFADLGAPLRLIRLNEPHLVQTFNATVLLLRPDLHVVWRGRGHPETAEDLARVATGHGPGFVA